MKLGVPIENDSSTAVMTPLWLDHELLPIEYFRGGTRFSGKCLQFFHWQEDLRD
jgi:hypothetical protein